MILNGTLSSGMPSCDPDLWTRDLKNSQSAFLIISRLAMTLTFDLKI